MTFGQYWKEMMSGLRLVWGESALNKAFLIAVAMIELVYPLLRITLWGAWGLFAFLILPFGVVIGWLLVRND